MVKKIAIKFVFAVGVMVSAIAWAATPTLDQVNQAAKAGNYVQAQDMMKQVLRDHPTSAKAHFVEAWLLAKQNKLTAARSELDTAKKLDPKLSFAKPEAIASLQSVLAGGDAQVQNAPEVQAGSVQVRPISSGRSSWSRIALIVGVILAIVAFLRARNRRADMPMSNGSAGPMGYGSGGVPPQTGGGGILGSLASGAAMGAGLAAGQDLMRKVLDRGEQNHAVSPSNDLPMQGHDNNSGDNMGGNNFGVNDPGSWDDSDSGGGDPGSWDSSDDSDSGGGDGWT